MFGDKSVRQPQLVEYVKGIGQGLDSARAFAQAFKSSAAEMEKQLRNYVARDSYTVNIYTLDSTEGEKEVAVRPISDAEADSYLGNLLARTNRLDEAEVLLKQAVAAEPDLPRAYEGLGLVAMRRSKLDESMEHFKQAATRGSKNHLAHYYYAQAVHRHAVGNLTSELAQKIGDALKTSIKLMPGFAHSHYALGFLSLATGENLKEGADSLKTAIRLAPQDKHFVLTLAQLQSRMQDYAAARKTLAPLLAPDSDQGLRSSAESTLKMIEYYSRPAPVSSEPPPVADKGAASGSTSSSPTAGQPSDKAPARVTGRPTIKIEGAQTIRGVLVSIECKAGKWTLVVNNRDGLLRFAVSDKDKLEFYSQDPQFEGSVSCGTVNKIAFIYFKQMAGQSKFAGDAVAVEFTQ